MQVSGGVCQGVLWSGDSEAATGASLCACLAVLEAHEHCGGMCAEDGISLSF